MKLFKAFCMTLILCLMIVFSASADTNSRLVLPADLSIIEAEAFEGVSGIGEVVLPEGITTIGAAAFANSSITTINLPASLTSIADDAFDGCSALTVTADVGTYAYTWAEAHGFIKTETPLEDFTYTVADGAVTITGYTGSDDHVTVPVTIEGYPVTGIGEYAFDSCDFLVSITIPNSVTSIGGYAFSNCSTLSSVILPVSWSATDSASPFTNCPALTSITIPNGTITIPDYAFDKCTSLTSITIPDCVTSIGNSAFSDTGLISITIPDSVTHIGNNAFSGTNFTSITIPDCVTSIDIGAFCDCTGLTSIAIPNSVTSIADYAFAGCTGLSSITIPDSVTSIGYCAFVGCTSLTSITIPDSVTSIGGYAFDGCSSLYSVTLPVSWSTTNYYTPFTNCPALTSIAIPDGTTAIPDDAFCGCEGLTNITIPDSVTYIGNRAFYGCTGLTSITIPDSVTYIDRWAFDSCTGLTSITIPNSVTYIGHWAFDSCTGLASITIPNSVTIIEFHAFSNCSSLVSIAIPSTVTTIGNYAFYNCPNLTIYSIFDSYARTYALENGISFSTAPFPGTETEPETDPMPKVIGFIMENNTITTGDAACFTIETANAHYVQLIVDGQYYDSMPVTSNVTVMGRMFTLAGERQVAFRAYGNGRWSEPCTVQSLTVTAAGMLDEPVYECSAKIWLGDTVTVKWSSVDNADGYVLYLNYPDGTSQAEGVKLDASTTTYTYKSTSFPVTGNYSIRIMAYGAGYSQSSVLAPFTVTDEYITWQGWPQRSKVNTYDTADSSTPNGYVDYLDPVTVLGEEDDCYFIDMLLTAGGSTQRYVRKNDIGKEPYTPGLTLSVSYARGVNGELYLYANTNLVGCKAGAELNGKSIGMLYSPTAVKLYTNVYAFKATPITGTTTYKLWAEDASGTRLVKELSVTVEENTSAPEITPSPAPTPKPEITASPEITVEPEVTPSPIVTPAPAEIIVPDETVSPELDVSCKYATASGHQLEYVLLEDMSLLLYNNGQIYVNSAVCPECGGTITDFGFVPDNVQTQFYFHPIAHYYDTSGNGQIYCTNHDYKLILSNEDLTITHSIDLNGAPLTVNGILRVEATLSNVGEIRCNELIIEKNGALIAQDATYLHVGKASSAGKIDIKDGGKLLINPRATIKAGNTTINGLLEGCDTLECTSLSVGSNGHLGLTNGFTANISKNFTFNSNTSHSASFGKNSILNISGDIRISGKQFSFNGTCNLKGKKQLLKMEKNDSNYFDVLDMSAGGSMLTINDDKTELINNNWNSSNSFKANTVKGSVIDSPSEAVVKKFFDFILINPLQSGSGFAWIEGASDFVKPLLNEKMQIDEEEYRKLLFKSVSPVEREVDPSDVITGEIGLITFDSLDNQEEIKQAIRYGLMTEMFIKQGTHDFDFSGFSLNFSAIKGDSLWYKYKDKKYTMELNGISMKTTTHEVSREIYFIEGTIKESNGKKNSFSYTTNLGELNDAALLLQAAGTAEMIAELESTLDSIVDSGKEALKLLDMFDELDYKSKLKRFVYEQCPIKVQEVGDWIEWIDDQFSDDEKQLFKDFKKYYDLSLEFYPPQP